MKHWRSWIGAALLCGAFIGSVHGQPSVVESPVCGPFREEWNKTNHGDLLRIRDLLSRLPPECATLKRDIQDVIGRQATATPTTNATGGATRSPAGASAASPPAVPASALLEVRGYVLSRVDEVPADAVAYAIPVFMEHAQAERFCPAFLSRLNFEGVLTTQTNLHVSYGGRAVEIVPFGWPVTLWTATSQPTCEQLVERYDYGRARTMLNIAREQLAKTGRQSSTGALSSDARGPFIVIARRVGGSIVVYDLSSAPDVDYDSWLLKTISGIEIESASVAPGVVRPGVRDQLRYVVFSALPTVSAALAALVPGFGRVSSLVPN